METLEQLRQQLESFTELGAIVRTMKALAAVNIRQYEQAVHALAPYYHTIELGLHGALRDMANLPPETRGPSTAVAAIVFGSDHGLCGRFNEDIAEYAVVRLREVRGAGEALRLMAVGARIRDLLEAGNSTVDEVMVVPGSAARITATVRRIVFSLEKWRFADGIERVYLLYNRPLKGSGFHPIGVQLLPVNLRRFQRLQEERWPSRTLPTFTMERNRLLSALLRQYLFVSLFRACAESLAAENASRLAAMQAAEKTLADRHEQLLGEFRRQRQDAITAELLDVVAGYEAIQSPARANRV